REAMVRQGKSIIRVTPERWGPVATGGFPARLAPRD
ncbi:PPOX class F420-dependent oxidoreductase, partial [Streptomyces sp. NPDC101213]